MKKAKTREKETIARKRLRDSMSPDEKVKMRTPEKLIESKRGPNFRRLHLGLVFLLMKRPR
jgi:hypothetical protein